MVKRTFTRTNIFQIWREFELIWMFASFHQNAELFLRIVLLDVSEGGDALRGPEDDVTAVAAASTVRSGKLDPENARQVKAAVAAIASLKKQNQSWK